MVARMMFMLFLFAASVVYGYEFTASLSRQEGVVGKPITLSLVLKDADPASIPHVAPLEKDFLIRGQQKSSNTLIMNGKVSSTTTFYFTLIPKKEGNVSIPAISIETSQGRLYTTPFSVNVVKGEPAHSQDSNKDSAFTLTSFASASHPYVHEPFAYTIKLIAPPDIRNVKMDKLQVTDAIAEMVGEPQTEDFFQEGKRGKILEIHYLITPLKAGKLVIPPVGIAGEAPSNDRSSFPSLFSNDFDPFYLMRRLDRLEPFILATDELAVEVKPPVPGVDPWLPAKDLSLTETKGKDNSYRVGEPFVREYLVSAQGIRASQLPTVEPLQQAAAGFKVYADKPKLQEEMQNGEILAKKFETFTFIPQAEGPHVLPEIRLSWWNTARNVKEEAYLPPLHVDVLPPIGQNPASEPIDPVSAPPQESMASQLMVLLIASLAVLLLIALFWIFTLNKRIAKLTATDAPSRPQSPKKIRPYPDDSISLNPS